MAAMPNDWARVFAPLVGLVDRLRKSADACTESEESATDTLDKRFYSGMEAARSEDADLLENALAHLREKVVPLLEASEAMRNHEMGHPSGFTRWDAAKAKLLAKGDVVSDWGISGALSVLPKGAKVPDAG